MSLKDRFTAGPRDVRTTDDHDLERRSRGLITGAQNAGRDHDVVIGRAPVFTKEARARWARERENAEEIAEMIRVGEYELNRRARGRG